MEQIVTENFTSTKSPLGNREGNLLPHQESPITEDLATFLVAHHVLISGNDSIASIKDYFKRVPEIFEIVDELLMQLEKADLISVFGDKITVNQSFVDLGGKPSNLRKFLPRLFKLASERVLNDAELGTHKAKREATRYFALPNDPETSAEAQALYFEYKAKMSALEEKSRRLQRKADSVRLIGIFNCSLVPEVFV